jgi:protein phosphatase
VVTGRRRRAKRLVGLPRTAAPVVTRGKILLRSGQSVIYYEHFGHLFGRLPAMSLKLRSVAMSHRGLIRGANQDSVHAGPWLLAVADGMGGMAAGDLASRIAIEAMRPLDVETAEENLVGVLQDAVDAANAGIRSAIAQDPERQGMGTTLTALLLARTGGCLALAHVGDSRAYLLRGGTMTQLTRDDTFVQLLVDEGVISAEEAQHHPRRAVVTRALQGEPLTPAYTTLVPREGDRWLLCSDGLSNVVPAEAIAETLLGHADPAACTQRLVDLALRAGGPDNITVVIADLVHG